MELTGIVQSMQVGAPQRYGAKDATEPMQQAWRTSFFRMPSDQPRMLFTTHLDGNRQADTKNHGHLNQAVLLYAAQHYPLWRDELGLPEMGAGGFGENFTVAGQSEADVCLGDVFAIGDALIRVEGPRYPCWKIARRWGVPDLTERVAATGRTGWYCSVPQEGMVAPGQPLALRERPYPQFTMALMNDFAHGRGTDRAQGEALLACPAVEDFWKKIIRKQMSKRRT